jgi:hypothetical protein
VPAAGLGQQVFERVGGGQQVRACYTQKGVGLPGLQQRDATLQGQQYLALCYGRRKR